MGKGTGGTCGEVKVPRYFTRSTTFPARQEKGRPDVGDGPTLVLQTLTYSGVDIRLRRRDVWFHVNHQETSSLTRSLSRTIVNLSNRLRDLDTPHHSEYQSRLSMQTSWQAFLSIPSACAFRKEYIQSRLSWRCRTLETERGENNAPRWVIQSGNAVYDENFLETRVFGDKVE